MQQLIPKQQIIPFAEFKQEQLANRAFARLHSKGSPEEIIKIPIRNVVFRVSKNESFNPRQFENYGDIAELAQTIKSFGQLEPGRVDALADGRFSVVEGHRRVCALLMIADENRDREITFKAVLNKYGTTEKERLIQSFITQTGKPLEQYELANLFSRLINNEGMTQIELAEVTGKTPAYISQLITFSKEPEEIKEMVRLGRLTVNDAVKLKGKIKDPTERIKAVKTAEEKKWENKEKRDEKFAENYEYDENLKRTVKKEGKDTTDDDVVKHIDNTVKGKRLKLDEIVSSNTVILPNNGAGCKWVSVKDKLPEPLETVFISDGKGWTSIGCKSDLYDNGEGEYDWCWAEIEGGIFEEDGKITAGCNSDDLDVQFWHKFPNPIKF